MLEADSSLCPGLFIQFSYKYGIMKELTGFPLSTVISKLQLMGIHPILGI